MMSLFKKSPLFYLSIFSLFIACLNIGNRSLAAEPAPKKTVTCTNPYIIDGDTFSCDETRIRLYGIDAPEMPDHCRKGRRCTKGNPFKSKNHLESLTRTQVTCKGIEIDSYGRTIARCTANKKDLSCEMVKAGQAVERYGRLDC